MIAVLIADHQTLTRKGIISILADAIDIDVVGEAHNKDELMYASVLLKPDVTLFDYDHFTDVTVENIIEDLKDTRLLVLFNSIKRDSLLELIDLGIKNFICKKCSRDEMVKAVYATAKGERFFCSNSSRHLEEPPFALSGLSVREIEIVQLVAAGMTNKEIAARLFLSIHTIKTHRKNIIKKLGFTFKNASDLVMYTSSL